jgi:hypothetical protein
MRGKLPELAEKIFEDSRELVNGGVELARAAIASGEAKDYNHATAGWDRSVKVLAASARGLEKDEAQAAPVAAANFNIFFSGVSKSEVKKVEIIDN